MMFIYLIAIAVSFVWLIQMFKEKRFFVRRTLLDIPILIFLASQILSTLFSIDRHTSLFGYYGRFNGGLVSTLTYIVLFYGFVTLFDKEWREKLLKWSLISSLLVILWGLPGRFGYDLSCYLYSGQLNNNCWTDQFRPAERMFSTLGQPNWLGAYLAINFFIGLYFFFKHGHSESETKNPILNRILHFVQDEKKKFFVFGFYLFLNFCGILFSRSRSALIAVGIGFILFFAFTYLAKERKKILQVALRPMGILLAIFLIAVLIFKTGIGGVDKFITLNRANERVKQINNTQAAVSSEISESFDIRKIVWKGALELGKKYPLFGTGVETFASSYYFVRPLEHNLTSEWDYLYNKAHNEYLNYLATTGFIGLIAYLSMIGAALHILFKKIRSHHPELSSSRRRGSAIQILNQVENDIQQIPKRFDKLTVKHVLSKVERQVRNDIRLNQRLLYIALFCSYIAILITNFFGFSTTTINLFFYILIPGLIVSKDLIWEKNWSRKTAFYIFAAGNIALLYLFVSLIFYFVADTYYAKGNNFTTIGDYQQSALNFGRAISLRYELVYEDKYSSSLANLAFIASDQKQKELVPRLINLSIFYNDQTLAASPQNVIYWKTRGKNDYLFYQINLDKKYLEDGVAALNRAQKLAPSDPKLPYSLAIYYSLLNDEFAANKEPEEREKAQLYKTLSLVNIDKAIKLKPDYRDAYFLKAQLEKKYGENDEAREALEYILYNINLHDDEVKKELESLVN